MCWGNYAGPHHHDVDAASLWPIMANVHAKYPKWQILATEATVARDTKAAPAGGTWDKGEHYAHDMIGDFNNWVVGFVDWNLALDSHGGPLHVNVAVVDIGLGSDAMLICSTKKSPFTCKEQAFYYYVGHFSKFVPEGSKRVQWRLSDPSSALETTAFLLPPDSGGVEQVVVVAMNAGNTTLNFTLWDAGATAEASLPPRSIQTLRYPRAP